MAFRFRHKKAHLTYRGHLPFDTFFPWFQTRVRNISIWSFVHETGHGDTNYDHTHFYFATTKSTDIRDARFFDWEGVHPHIQPVTTSQHERKIYHEYHKK